jgi:type III pantothenate kinase
MTKLLIDLGNSCLKWAIKTSDGISSSHSLYYQNQNFQVLLEKAWKDVYPSKVVLASVAEEALNLVIAEYAQKKWGLPLTVLNTQLETLGLQNHYATPLLLGVDRWAFAIAAWEQYHVPLCLVSCGTAITTDIINGDGQLLGGTISPGLGFMCQALSARAAKLKTVDQQFFEEGELYQPQLEAKDTFSAMQNGALLMSIAFLDQTVQRLQSQYGSAMQFIIRGGDAAFLLPHLAYPFESQPELVIQGIDLLDEVL